MKRKTGYYMYLKNLLFYQRTIKLPWARIMTDYNCQLAYLQRLEHALGDAYKDPREYTGVRRATDSGGKYVSLKKSSQQGVPKNVCTIPYLMWAYDVTKCTFKRKIEGIKAKLHCSHYP
jgi:hypothetical protein